MNTKIFSVTYRKSNSVNIHASFSTPKEAKKWMDEMLAQRIERTPNHVCRYTNGFYCDTCGESYLAVRTLDSG